ncbi:ras guanine nucleotide exchange factor domain-containing protein [Irpex rosettiformis]|uniref:Ras guanine nucleotide exchange factor domain-containing protein n=1 Tax=Irpex rosettiformis TaxID=378272 RepID=A0ACB8U0P1_9APHY|nr:ras guanine nucleotide exchange factor domain-containing protein [Irpex rosettiformis]
MPALPLRIDTATVVVPRLPSASPGYDSAPPSRSPDDDGEDDSEYVLAMHDFQPEQPNVTCLAFKAGQIIRVCNRDPSGWWDGELDSRRGWFPSNYVTSEVGLLTDEELPQLLRRTTNGHAHSTSVASAASCTRNSESQRFSRTDHRPMEAGSSMDAYCPRIMIPLLQALSLLQKVTRANRTTHFKPATACIISAVRSMLSDLGCLPRDAPLLQQYPTLAKERKRILGDLATLADQTKKASEAQPNGGQRDSEADSMIKGSGQLFAHVRGFLAVLAQCGIDVEPRPSSLGSQPERWWGSEDGTVVRAEDDATPLPGGHPPYWEPPTMSPKSAIALGNTAEPPWAAKPPSMHKSGQLSTSSISSASSGSSNESFGTPPTPVFPSGPSTTAEVMDALRHTHDNYLSTIAAFIGHAHSHSRTSHASSTGHMYDLVREVVEMVCRLLTIVEAVLRHPDIPPARAQDLKAAKEGLYNVTSTLADSVRQLTTAPLPGVSEEEEKTTLLRSATNALKAGSDCVNAVKKCLHRAKGERSFIIELPSVGEATAIPNTPSKFSHAHKKSENLRITTSKMNALRESYRIDVVEAEAEDFPVQAPSFSAISPPRKPDVDSDPDAAVFSSEVPLAPATDVSSTSSSPLVVDEKPLRTEQPLRGRTSSPVSSCLPSEEGTTWEGPPSTHRSSSSVDTKIHHGDLPPVPEAALPELPRVDQTRWDFAHDHAPDDVAFNSDGQLVGATLAALVERMSPHASVAESPFSSVFWVTFRQFTTPLELLDALIERYNRGNPDGLTQYEILLWQHQKGVPTRLRVSNLIKTWLENWFRPQTDSPVLEPLEGFVRGAVSAMFPQLSVRILDSIERWKIGEGMTVPPKPDRVRDVGVPLNPPSATVPTEIPRPIMTKSLLSVLRNKNYSGVSVIDFDPLELARQLTVMECTLYCSIQPEEVLDIGKPGCSSADSVKAVTSLSTVITGWVAESILNEGDTKKRTALIKFWIKLADRCSTLQNFSTPRSILAALDSSTISRLHQTWTGLPQKNRLQLDVLRKLADHARNYHEYRARLRNTVPPAVPFLGLYLTDITFCREGNPSYRTSPKNPEKQLLNFNKYHKLARIIQGRQFPHHGLLFRLIIDEDMQRFQVPYTLKEIPEVQEYLKDAFEKSKNRTDLQDLYRRSLLIEPKRAVDQPPSSDVRQPLFQWARSQPSVTSSTSS